MTANTAAQTGELAVKTFFETVPPNERRDLLVTTTGTNSADECFTFPSIELFCPHEQCGGPRFFDPVLGTEVCFSWASGQDKDLKQRFVAFRCRNCESTMKTYAVVILMETSRTYTHNAMFVKVGESPRFGEPRPNAVASLLQDDIQFFDRGFRAELEGLGIGAFAYYRRFVERHKDRIIAEIRKVAVAQGLAQEILDGLDRAATRREFSAAVEEIKDAIPPSLKINGANPLTLLHDALSEGLHSEDDVECLAIAHDIRLVLTGLAERSRDALQNNAELSAAVTRLNQKRSGQQRRQP